MIALFGGSFDPVHIGHIKIIEKAVKHYNLEKAKFIPAYQSKLKKDCHASAEHRVRMLELAIKNKPFLEISDYEIRTRNSYTINTINHFKKKLKQNPVFIIGTDALLELSSWKSPSELLKKTEFIIIKRNHDTETQIREYLTQKFPNTDSTKIHFLNLKTINISSTMIRHRIKKGKSIKHLVPPGVDEYVKENKLYI